MAVREQPMRGLARQGTATLIVGRPRLEAALDAALTHRLTLIVADEGFGKSVLVNGWAAGVNAVVYEPKGTDGDVSQFVKHLVDALQPQVPDLGSVLSGALGAARGPDSHSAAETRPDALAALLGRSLAGRLTRDLVLVVDGAERLKDRSWHQLLAGLVRHVPPLLHLVVTSRRPLALRAGRLQRAGQVPELHGTDLAFTETEIAALLDAAIGGVASVLAEQVHRITAGWPLAVHLVVQALQQEQPESFQRRLAQVAGQGEIHELVGMLVAGEPQGVRSLLATIALLGEVHVELATELCGQGAATLPVLARRGTFVEPVPGTPGWYRLNGPTSTFLSRHPSMGGQQSVRLRVRAADWFLRHGRADAALSSLVAAGDHAGVAALLRQFGERLANAGFADGVIAAVAVVPTNERDPVIERVAGAAHQVRGDWSLALSCFERAAACSDRLAAGLAWRMGLIHHLRGDLAQALALYGRGDGDDESHRDRALLLAWRAAAHWLRGEVEICRHEAVRALDTAVVSQDPEALAAGHTVMAMVAALDGDRRTNDAHYVKALEYAERAGDVLQQIRIHTNRGSHYLEEGAYQKALAELEVAITQAEATGFLVFGGLALTNRGEVLVRLGRLEEARADLNAALALYQAIESRHVAYALEKLGDLERLAGEGDQAKTAYEGALHEIERAGDIQAMVPALAGLARVLAEEDPAEAGRLAERAIACGEGLGYVDALLAAAWVARCRGDKAAAISLAEAAKEIAEQRRDRAATAEALTIAAEVSPSDAIPLAEAAISLWREVGDPVGEARARLVRAAHLDPAAARDVAADVRRAMAAIGCRWVAGLADRLLERHPPDGAPRISIETLGAFRVLRDGVPIPASAWQSRKARELLKILVSRRGRPMTREALMDLLWPGEDPTAVANRLNVALSTVRSVFDPEREELGDHYLCVQDDSVRLDLEHITVDVERFLHAAGGGLRLLQAGPEASARSQLALAESSYGGDFLEEDLYEDWSVPLREEARATYIAVARQLGALAAEAADADAACRYYLRLLQRDPYDEQGHLYLVATLAAAGRQGDARRFYRAYVERMQELGVDPEPFAAANRLAIPAFT